MIQSVYKGVEIEMELHQQAHDYWKCDYTLIKHPGRTQTIHHGDKERPNLHFECPEENQNGKSHLSPLHEETL